MPLHSVDEFVYQYTSFALWRNKVAGKTEEEKQILAESGQVRAHSVTRVLRKG
jgi:translation initiation factor 3 subunit L